MDMEWRASYLTVEEPVSIALVQLAIRSKVYLLDMIGLNDTGRHDEVAAFFANVFGDDKITKLGYDIKSDLTKLQESYPYLKQAIADSQSFVDLKTTQANVEQVYPLLLNIDRNDKRRPYRGLNELLHCCLGEPLNKDEQMSGWELRPLRLAQTKYAGMYVCMYVCKYVFMYVF